MEFQEVLDASYLQQAVALIFLSKFSMFFPGAHGKIKPPCTCGRVAACSWVVFVAYLRPTLYIVLSGGIISPELNIRGISVS